MTLSSQPGCVTKIIIIIIIIIIIKLRANVIQVGKLGMGELKET